MEEIEVPTEHLHDAIREKAEELLGKSEGRLTVYIALSTALMAVFAALAGLMAGHHSNEALIDQIRASDQWAFYQAKSIKSEIRLLQASPPGSSGKTPEEIKKEEGEIKKTAEELESSSAEHLKKHIWLARSVTFFQIAIAVSAMSILTKKAFLWYAGILISLIGLSLFITGLF